MRPFGRTLPHDADLLRATVLREFLFHEPPLLFLQKLPVDCIDICHMKGAFLAVSSRHDEVLMLSKSLPFDVVQQSEDDFIV